MKDYTFTHRVTIDIYTDVSGLDYESASSSRYSKIEKLADKIVKFLAEYHYNLASRVHDIEELHHAELGPDYFKADKAEREGA